MNYWLDLFTGTTWDEFRKASAKTTGFEQRLRGYPENVTPGDIFICYLTGLQRWVKDIERDGNTVEMAASAFRARLD